MMSTSTTSVTAKEATRILGLPHQHFIAGYIKINILQAERLGNVIKIDRTELKRFAEKYGLPYNENGSEPKE